MLKNHYLKKKLRPQDRLSGQFDSFIFDVLPPDELITKENILALAKARPDCPRTLSERSLSAGVDWLVQTKFVEEILGVNLERFIERGKR